MSEEKKYPKVVIGAFILNKEGKFLLMKGPKFENKYICPGGHIDWGEKMMDALKREVKEEVGIDVYDPTLLNNYEFVLTPRYSTEKHILALNYLVETDAEENSVVLDKREATEYAWLTPEEIINNQEVNPEVRESVEIYLEKNKKDKKGLFSRECKNCDEIKSSVEEYKSGWQRALADYNNLKNEVAKEKADWAVWSEQRILEEFIPVYGNFKKAFAVETGEVTKEQENWATGIKYIMKQYGDILRNHQVEEIKTVGEKFDPVYHEALGEEESDIEEGIIVKEIDGGYTVKGKVMKVAKVILAK